MSITPAVTRWAALVAEQQRSGLAVREFAAKHGLNPSTLGWWRSRLRSLARANALTSAPHAFVELAVEKPRTATSVLRLRFDDRPIVLEVADGVSLDLVRQVVEALC